MTDDDDSENKRLDRGYQPTGDPIIAPVPPTGESAMESPRSKAGVNITPECRAKLDVLRAAFEIKPSLAALVEWLVDREIQRRELIQEK